MMQDKQSLFSIALGYREAHVFYQGHKTRVQVRAHDGQTINLPWSMLQPHFTSQGVVGTFKLPTPVKANCFLSKRSTAPLLQSQDRALSAGKPLKNSVF